MIKRTTEPELLPGADDRDCQPIAEAGSLETDSPGLPNANVPDSDLEEDEDEAAEDHHAVTWTTVDSIPTVEDVLASWRPVRGRWSVTLERVALAVERPINKLTTVQLNPLYHTGTIAFFLLGIVGLTGLYLFFFYQYGFDASYQAVARMESQFIARIIRAVHRYASGALVIATLLHAYRALFLEKFRGPRWLAWLTGVLMTAMVWLAGVTGYWLIWDERAQVINDIFRDLVAAVSDLGPSLAVFMATAGERGSSWSFFLIILAVHVILFLALVGFFVLHIKRLKRPQWLPPVHWVVAVAGVVVVLSALFPVDMLPQASLDRLPGTFGIDPLFLFYLPFGGAWWFWLALGMCLLGIAALPWLGRARLTVAADAVAPPTASAPTDSVTPVVHPRIMLPPPVNILKDRCTGCTKCALDCPYGAIEMVERHDGKPHKFIAIEDTSLCVSCGICVGSCDGVAVTLGRTMPESLWQLVEQSPGTGRTAEPSAPTPTQLTGDPRVPTGMLGATVVYTCDRHARHGAQSYLRANAEGRDRGDPVVVVLPCVGALPPDLTVRTLKAGAAEVRVIGCPPGDCTNREGNLWTEQRLRRERLPRLRKPYAAAPIAAFWLPPNDFRQGLDAAIATDDAGQPDYDATRGSLAALSWRRLAPAVLLLAAVLMVQILLNDIPFTPYPNPPAMIEVVVEHGSEPFGQWAPAASEDDAYELQIILDGEIATSQRIAAVDLLSADPAGTAPLYLKKAVEPGQHHVIVQFQGLESGTVNRLFNGQLTLEPGQVLRPSPDFSGGTDCPVGVLEPPVGPCER